MLRREIELLKHPPGDSGGEKTEEEAMEVTEPVVEDEAVEEVNGGLANGDAHGGEVKAEEVGEEKEEDEMSDEEGLFSSEFDNLMDPSGFQNDMGFAESMDWMNEV